MVNLHNELSQTRSHAIWTDEERAAFCSRLTANLESDSVFTGLSE